MKRKILLLSVTCLFSGIVTAEDLMKIIGKEFQIFSEDRPRFIKPSNARFFRWTSEDKMSARYPVHSNMREKLTLLGEPVPEVIVRFKENKVSRIYISVYNRGDNQPVSVAIFQKRTQELYNFLRTLYPGEKPVRLKEKLSDGMYVHAAVWRGKRFSCILKWSFSGKSGKSGKFGNPEYLQLEFEPYDPANDPAKRSLVKADRTAIAAKKSLPENVRREANGNIYISNIPMVDQGQQGYCVAAVLERVFLYYNIPVNQHTLAQLCGTTASGGTSVENMVKTLDDVSRKFGIRIHDEYNLFPGSSAISNLKKLVSSYNRLAKKARKKPVKMVIRNRMVYLDETIYGMDPELYANVRNGDADFRKFQKIVIKNVQAGVPVIWCVMLGIMPEEKLSLQSKGGHMRLIIGFNEKNQEILYTDTWGIGHELKSMPIQYAWAITNRLLYLLPRERKMN